MPASSGSATTARRSTSSTILRSALAYAGALGLPIVDHPEDATLTAGAEANDGFVATVLGLSGWPDAAEEAAVARDLAILADVVRDVPGARLHLTHVSTAGALELIRRAKAAGLPVTCDVTPHHLALTDEWIAGARRWAWDADGDPWADGAITGRAVRPVAAGQPAAALAGGRRRGPGGARRRHGRRRRHATTPRTPRSTRRSSSGSAANGISGIETALGLLLAAVDAGRLPLARAIEALTTGPAARAGRPVAPQRVGRARRGRAGGPRRLRPRRSGGRSRPDALRLQGQELAAARDVAAGPRPADDGRRPGRLRGARGLTRTSPRSREDCRRRRSRPRLNGSLQPRNPSRHSSVPDASKSADEHDELDGEHAGTGAGSPIVPASSSSGGIDDPGSAKTGRRCGTRRVDLDGPAMVPAKARRRVCRQDALRACTPARNSSAPGRHDDLPWPDGQPADRRSPRSTRHRRDARASSTRRARDGRIAGRTWTVGGGPAAASPSLDGAGPARRRDRSVAASVGRRVRSRLRTVGHGCARRRSGRVTPSRGSDPGAPRPIDGDRGPRSPRSRQRPPAAAGGPVGDRWEPVPGARDPRDARRVRQPAYALSLRYPRTHGLASATLGTRLRAPLLLAGDDAGAAGPGRAAAAGRGGRRRHRRRLRRDQRRARAGPPRRRRSRSLEAHTLGWGASTRNGGIVHAGYKWGPTALLKRYGEETGRALYRETLESYALVKRLIADEAIDCDFREVGHLELAYAPSHVAELEHARDEPRLGRRDRRRSSRASASARRSAPTPTTARSRSRAAGCSTRAATSPGSPRPRTAPARTSTRASGRPRSDARRDGRFVVETERGAILARDVFVATNGYTDGVAPTLRRRVIPIGSYIIASEPLPEDLAHELSPEGPRVLRHEELPLLLARVGRPPDDLRRTRELPADEHRPVGRDPPQGPARGPSAARRATGSSTRGAATSASRSTGCRTSGRTKDGVTYALGCCGTGVALMTHLGTAVGAWLAGGEAPGADDAQVPARPGAVRGPAVVPAGRRRVVPAPGPAGRAIAARPTRPAGLTHAQAPRGPALHVPRPGPVRRRRAGPRSRDARRRSPAIGYLGVETVDVPGGDPVAARRALGDAGLAVASSHTWARIDDARRVRARVPPGVAALGSRHDHRVGQRVRLGRGGRGVRRPPERRGRGRRPSTGCARLSQPQRRDAAARWRPRRIGGCVERVDPAVVFQVDIFWVVVGGADPADVIDRARRSRRLAPRQGRRDAAERAAGRRAVRQRAGRRGRRGSAARRSRPPMPTPGIEWLIVEFDHVAGSPLEAVRRELRVPDRARPGRGRAA